MAEELIKDNYATVEETQKEFQCIDNWNKFWKMVVSYTHYILTNKYQVKSEKGLNGKTASDFAQEVIIGLNDGTRKWNVTKNPTLFSQVKSSVDSHVNNYFTKNKLEEYQINDEISNIDLENNNETDELFDYCYKTLESLKASDNELLVFHCQADGLTKPQEIAEELGITTKEVYNIQKQLRRKLPELHKKLTNYGC